MVLGRITTWDRHTDNPGGRYCIQTNQHSTSIKSPFLCRVRLLLQPSQFILAWDRHRNMLDCIPPQLGSKLHIIYIQCTINTTRLPVSQSVTVSCCGFSCCDTEWSQQQWAWFSCWELSCCDGLASWRWAWLKWAFGHCTAVGAGQRVWLTVSAPQNITVNCGLWLGAF